MIRRVEKETKQIRISIRNQTRTVTIERSSSRHSWFALIEIVCKFRSGERLHKKYYPEVVQRGSLWFFPSQVVHGRKHAVPVAFSDEKQLSSNSGWTG